MFTRRSDMKKHVEAVHKAIKSILCTFKGCNKVFAQEGNMRSHVRRMHDRIRDIQCTEEKCDMLFYDNSDMTNHVKQVHMQIRNVMCTEPGCEQMFSKTSNMRAHVEAAHKGTKVPCTYGDCSQSFSTSAAMRKHISAVHQGVKDVACTFASCEQMFFKAGDMRVHYLRWHTKEGQQKKVKKQDRLHRLLKQNFAIDAECHIRYANGCIPDPDKYCARLDFHIVGILEYTVIVECDEFGHINYLVPCEQSRMVQVAEAIQAATQADAACAPIVFVRYNCDSATLDGVKLKTTLKQRETVLIKYLTDILEGRNKFEDPLNLVYINYNASYARPSVAVTEGDTVIASGACAARPTEARPLVAEVTQDSDFQMHNAVKDVVVVK